MNTERVNLSMTTSEADKIAYVLMSALRTTSMTDSERATTTNAANVLFTQLGYRVRTNDRGVRTHFLNGGCLRLGPPHTAHTAPSASASRVAGHLDHNPAHLPLLGRIMATSTVDVTEYHAGNALYSLTIG